MIEQGKLLVTRRVSRGKMPTVGNQGKEQAASLQQVGWAGLTWVSMGHRHVADGLGALNF